MASTSVLASASNATVSVFDTVARTATAVTTVVNGVTTGANMFGRLMDDMDNNHRKRSILNQALYEKELLETTAREISYRQKEILKELNEDSTFKKIYEENYTELESLLNPVTPE